MRLIRFTLCLNFIKNCISKSKTQTSNHLKVSFLTFSRWQWVFIVCFFTGLVTYPVEFMRQGDKKTINFMFSSLPLQENTLWKDPAVPFNLVVFCLLNYILTILALSCTIPAGIPYCVFGAALGWLYAIILKGFAPHLIIHEEVYAIIGSAAFIASVTWTMSIAIIVFEMNQ